MKIQFIFLSYFHIYIAFLSTLGFHIIVKVFHSGEELLRSSLTSFDEARCKALHQSFTKPDTKGTLLFDLFVLKSQAFPAPLAHVYDSFYLRLKPTISLSL